MIDDSNLQNSNPAIEETTDENIIDEAARSPETDFEKLAQEYLDSLQRLKAEFDNYRKRIQKERYQLAEIHQSQVIELILPILDSFDAAFQHESERTFEEYREGIRMIHQSLITALVKLGLERMGLLNQAFDPSKAEAVATVVQPDQTEDTVAEEILAGYQFKSRILRPAKVVVAIPPRDADSEQPAG